MQTAWSLLSVLFLLNAGPAVRFEDGGVRVGGELVRGALVELREGLLVSGSLVEPTGGVVLLEAAPGRLLRLEPGVRASRAEGGLLLSTHGGRELRLRAGEARATLAAPVLLRATGKGWLAGGTPLEGPELLAQVRPQDDPDANLKAMQEAARRMEERPGALVIRRRRALGGGDVTVPNSAAIDKEVLLTSPQLSPFGN